MSDLPVAESTPRVWIGCLAHYNNGDLVGQWFDALGAEEVTLAQVHEGSGHGHSECEELWVMDTDNMPNDEMCPLVAGRWGKLLDQVPVDDRPAIIEWYVDGDFDADEHGLPDIEKFRERYVGKHDSFRAYAESYAEDIGLLADVPEFFRTYFDWDQWVADLEQEHLVIVVGYSYANGVYVFRYE